MNSLALTCAVLLAALSAGCQSTTLWGQAAEALPTGDYAALQEAHATMVEVFLQADVARARALFGGLAGKALLDSPDEKVRATLVDLRSFYQRAAPTYLGAMKLGRRRALAVDYRVQAGTGTEAETLVSNLYYFIEEKGGFRLEIMGNRVLREDAPAEVFHEFVKAIEDYDPPAWLELFSTMAPEMFETIDEKLGPDGMETFAARLKERRLSDIFVKDFAITETHEDGRAKAGELAAVIQRADGQALPLAQPIRFVCVWEQPAESDQAQPRRLWRLADAQFVPESGRDESAP